MPVGFSEIYCHIVWRVAEDSSEMNSAMQKVLQGYFTSRGDEFGYKPVAISVLNDHIHLFAQLMPGVAPGALAELVKHQSTIFMIDEMALKTPPIWDNGYGVVSVSKSHTDIVSEYVRTQEFKHKSGKTNSTLERVRS